MLNALITNCELTFQEDFDTALVLKLEFTSSHSVRVQEYVVGRVDLNEADQWSVPKENDNLSLIVKLMCILDVANFSDIKGTYCRINVNSEDKVDKIMHILHDSEQIDLRNFV